MPAAGFSDCGPLSIRPHPGAPPPGGARPPPPETAPAAHGWANAARDPLDPLLQVSVPPLAKPRAISSQMNHLTTRKSRQIKHLERLIRCNLINRSSGGTQWKEVPPGQGLAPPA